MNVKIEASWKERLRKEFEKPYFENIVNHIKTEKLLKKIIYPAGVHIFNAFDTTPFDKIKALILGQDPYHQPAQAHGLCFSVQKGVPPPPSLVNIFKELKEDIGLTTPNHGDLTSWAQQGVFLLNASLTVRAGEPMSHSKIGWATFTDAVIKKISDEKEHIVFMLWGKFAQEKSIFINAEKH
ncbi:MAG TPA: uracil-DNA glycosylase, partial [Niabella sp.]|nr:uracil-DNA glycosylase [Niabella sp.]